MPPTRSGKGATNFADWLVTEKPVKDGNIMPLLFPVDGLRGPQSSYREKEAERGQNVLKAGPSMEVLGRRANYGGGGMSNKIVPRYDPW